MFEVNEGIIQVSYIIATILFILALGGLSNQETARRGNWYGIIGMAIALVATLAGDVTQNFEYMIVALLVGGTVGIIAARRVQMTQMPELVAAMFSNEPVNHALAGMMGAALLGLAFISLTSITGWMSAQRGLGVAMLILVVETAYLMLAAGTMLVTMPTTVSLVAAAAVAFFLLI